ncbi:MAG: hypothetical protein ACPIOQ_42215 [Promethearchaeia archaeon]
MSHVLLIQEELQKCREAFEQFDVDKSGTIEPWELKVSTAHRVLRSDRFSTR